jgi:(p)ppGpp synthase/HD superfamily hydrolase
MTIVGYSDRINHALAFAAKHHDQQVRKGTRAPYVTQPANVGIILTRYDLDEDTVIAGILVEVMADYAREGYTSEMLDQRIGEKFGLEVLRTLLSVAERRDDEEGIELSAEERRDDRLERLSAASDRARWVCAADTLHHAASVLAELRRTVDPDAVWQRYAAGRERTIRWFRRMCDRLHEIGFDAPIMRELEQVTTQLELGSPPPAMVRGAR